MHACIILARAPFCELDSRLGEEQKEINEEVSKEMNEWLKVFYLFLISLLRQTSGTWFVNQSVKKIEKKETNDLFSQLAALS